MSDETTRPPAKAADEIYCPSCGQPIKRDAVICIHCGVQIKPMAPATPPMPPKDKTVAVLLAVFLSFWTWVYTYKKDATKFWIGLTVSIVGWFLLFIPTLGIWIWAIVDAATRPQEFYSSFSQTGLPPSPEPPALGAPPAS